MYSAYMCNVNLTYRFKYRVSPDGKTSHYCKPQEMKSFLIIQYALNKTDSDVVFLDSITTALSLTGMLLLARRKLENWIYWIIADIIYIPLYIYKELYPTSLQFFIFLILAILGYRNWKKELKK